MSEMGQAIEAILSDVTEVSGRVDDIAAGASEQAQGLGEINTGITTLDEVTQKNAAMVNESAASGRALLEKAAGLRAVVARFDADGFEQRLGAPTVQQSAGHHADTSDLGWSTADAISSEFDSEHEQRDIPVKSVVNGSEAKWEDF